MGWKYVNECTITDASIDFNADKLGIYRFDDPHKAALTGLYYVAATPQVLADTGKFSCDAANLSILATTVHRGGYNGGSLTNFDLGYDIDGNPADNSVRITYLYAGTKALVSPVIDGNHLFLDVTENEGLTPIEITDYFTNPNNGLVKLKYDICGTWQLNNNLQNADIPAGFLRIGSYDPISDCTLNGVSYNHLFMGYHKDNGDTEGILAFGSGSSYGPSARYTYYTAEELRGATLSINKIYDTKHANIILAWLQQHATRISN